MTHGAVTDIVQTSDGYLWLASWAGFFQYAGGHWRQLTHADGLPENHLKCMTIDATGAIWIGKWSGLLHERRGEVTEVTSGDSAKALRTMSCHEDSSGTLWLGTFGSGLARYQTRWFMLVSIALVGWIVYQGYRWRLQYLEAKRRQLEAQIAERTAQLRLSDAKNKAILQSLPDALFRLDAAGTYLEFFASPGFKTYVPPQEFLGKKIAEVLPPDIARAMNGHIGRALQTKQAQNFEYELTKEGRQCYYEMYLVAMGNDEVLAIVRDISTRKQAERTLRDFEHLRLIAEASPIAMSVSRLADGVLVYANHHVEQVLGLPLGEIIGRRAPDFYCDPADRAKVLEGIRQYGRLQQYELKVKKPDGTPFWILFSCQRIIFDGEPAVLTGYYDITARKKAEQEIRRLNEDLEQRVMARTQALQESETKFRTLAEMATAGIFIYQGEQMRYVNPAAQQISGYAREELLRMKFWDIIHPDLQALVRERGFARQRSEPVPQRYEVKILRKDGEERWIDFTASRIEYEGERAVLGTALDITQRKQLEERLQQYADKLEVLVEQRTRRIKELERQRAEQEKLAATGRMAARIAHEINNPLGGIRTSFHLLSRAVPEEHRHYEYVGLIEKEIDRIAQIVRQMLDLHQPQQETVLPLWPDQTIAEVLVMLQPKAEERGIHFEHEVQRAHAKVLLPENMLRQILYNLVLNAIEASEAGGEVRLQAEVTARQLVIVVVDRGHGIAEEIRPRIFEPFFTTKNKAATGGMGLGLSICKGLIEALHGSIRFDSKPGVGTKCSITIPLDQD